MRNTSGHARWAWTLALAVGLAASAGVSRIHAENQTPEPVAQPVYVPMQPFIAATEPPHTGVRNSAWEILGMGGGGTTQWPCVSPFDPKLVVQECDMTGGYVSTDGANSWRMFNLKAGLHRFAFDPQQKNVMYALNAGVWRSEDTGKTWKLVFPDPDKNTREWDNGDHGEYFLFSDDPSYPGSGREFQWESLAVDPLNSKHLVMGTGELDHAKGVVLESQDYGKTWKALPDLPGGSVAALWFHHDIDARDDEPDIPVAFAGPTVANLRDGKWTLLDLPEKLFTKRASIGVRKSETYGYIIAGAEDAPGGSRLFSMGASSKWLDVGKHFINHAGSSSVNLAGDFHAIACCEKAAEIAYVAVYHMTFEDKSYLNGIAKTVDGGITWQMVFEEPANNAPGTKTADNYQPSWLEARMAGGGWNVWYDAPRGLAVAPGNANVVYAADCFRSMMTSDGGKTWQQTNSVKAGDNGWTSRGIDVTNCYGIHFDPFDARHMILSQTDMGAFQTHDGGKSWQGATEGIPNKWRNTTYWIQFDPKVKDLVWGVFAGNHDLPRLKMYRHTDTDKFQGGVAVSTDGGKSWTPSNAGMDETAATCLVLDPASPVGARVLYATGFGRGVYKSSDNGKTWALKIEGIEKIKPCAWRLTRADDGTLYLVVFRRAQEKVPPGGEDDGAVYVSKDGAEHWTKLPLPADCNGPNGITVDPLDGKKLYLSAWARYTPDGPKGGGAYVSLDGGQTWKSIFTAGPHTYDLTVDPTNTQVLYVCGFDSAAWRSDDGGATWAPLKGYNFKWGYRVILDPQDATKVYITTFGGGLWHGPAKGDPNAVEDVATVIPSAMK